jgi:hypothetical protein
MPTRASQRHHSTPAQARALAARRAHSHRLEYKRSAAVTLSSSSTAITHARRSSHATKPSAVTSARGSPWYASQPLHSTQPRGAGSRGAVQDRPWLPLQGACRGQTRCPWAREAGAWCRRRRAQPRVSGTRVAVYHRMAIRPSTATSNGCASVPRYATSASISTGPPTWFVPAVSTVKLSPPAAMKLLAATT